MTAKTAVPRGAHLSNKQIARAAVDGKIVTFFSAPESILARGYVVGMDDYHWMVYTSSGDIALVHKSAPMVKISEIGPPDEIHKAARVGESFWAYCRENILGIGMEKPSS